MSKIKRAIDRSVAYATSAWHPADAELPRIPAVDGIQVVDEVLEITREQWTKLMQDYEAQAVRRGK